MSSRRAWCQSRLNSSCSRASSSVRLNISLRRWTPRTVCTARLGRPLSTQYMGAKRSSSIRGSASFRKTSAQLLSRRLAFFGVTRNWDCQRLSCGSRIRNILPSLGQAQRPRPFITLSPPCPRMARGFYEQINLRHLPISGPAGSGKTQEARRLLDAAAGPMLAADFQSILAALLLLERLPNGRYPNRNPAASGVVTADGRGCETDGYHDCH